MPRKKTPEQRLLMPRNQATQCNLYLEAACLKESKWVQTIPLEPRLNVGSSEAMGCEASTSAKRKVLEGSEPFEKRIKLDGPLTLAEKYIRSIAGPNYFTFKKSSNGILEQLEVTHSSASIQVSRTIILDPIRILLSSCGTISVLTLFKQVHQDSYLNLDKKTLNTELIDETLGKFSEKYVFCNGIPEIYKDFKTKNLELIKYPFVRLQSIECPVWFVPPCNVPGDLLKGKLYQCGNCRYLQRYVHDQEQKKMQTTPRKKKRTQSAKSRCRISVLTPRSKSKRIYENRLCRFNLNKKIKDLEKKLEGASVKLCEDQHLEMCQLVQAINSNGEEELKKVFQEASEQNKTLGHALSKAWETDSKKKEFQKDQERCIKGYKGNRWSPLTYRIALSVYSRSPAAYEALASFDVLKLPSVYAVQQKARKIPTKQGIDLMYLNGESQRFDIFQKNYEGKIPPPKEGALIFDEVKIIGKLMWNSKTDKFVGCALSPSEFPSLEDLYKENTINKTLEAEYVLQFLWRCVAGKFDIIGPYFMMAYPVPHQVISNTVLRCIWGFQAAGFETVILVCDGGSSNIASLRHSLGVTNAQMHVREVDGTLNFKLQPYFIHPYIPDRCISWVICPSHQLKNMVNALHHSQKDGTKDFVFQEVHFGWQQIIDLKAREDDRRDSDELAQVKGLTQAYVDRDPWTKLNVAPARIMQKLAVIGELYNYANPDPRYEQPPTDREKVMACHNFLTACNKIFEEGLLSHDKVDSIDEVL